MDDREKESPPVEAVEEAAPAEDRPVEPAEPGEAGWTDDAAQLKTQIAYLAAEFDNYRKRAAREREAQAAFGN